MAANSNLPICINGQNIEDIEQFVYLKALLEGTELDIARSINSDKFAFAVLTKFSKCDYININISRGYSTPIVSRCDYVRVVNNK